MLRREGGKSGDVGWPVSRWRDRPEFCCATRLGDEPLEAGGLRDDQVADRLSTNHEGVRDAHRPSPCDTPNPSVGAAANDA